MRGLRAVVGCVAWLSSLGAFAEEPSADAGFPSEATALGVSPPNAGAPRGAGEVVPSPPSVGPSTASSDAGTASPSVGVPVSGLDAGAPTRGSAEAQAAAFVAVEPANARVGELAALRVDGTFAVGQRAWLRGMFATFVAPAGSSFTLPGYAPKDNGSTFTLGFGSPDAAMGELSFTVAPLGSQRIRPTFEWADASGRPLAETAPAPTFLGSWRSERLEAFAALHVGNGAVVFTNATELLPGGLAGVSLLLGSGWTLEGRGAVYDRGDNPSLAYQGVRKRVAAWGATARLGRSLGGGVEPQWDPVTYAGDPELFERPLARGSGTEPVAATVLLESGAATQPLRDPNVFGATTPEPAGYVDFQARLRLGGLRLYATVRARSMSLVVFDVPGFPQDFATGRISIRPELSAIAGAELRLASWLSPNVLLRVRRPAALGVPALDSAGNVLPPGSHGSHTILIYGPARYADLPLGVDAQPEVTATVSARLEPSPDVLVLLNLDGRYNPNAVTFRDSPMFVATPVWEPSFTLSGSATLLVHFH